MKMLPSRKYLTHEYPQHCGMGTQYSVMCLGCNMGMGNSAVSQPQVPQVQVWFRNSGPKAVPQPITTVSWVLMVLSRS